MRYWWSLEVEQGAFAFARGCMLNVEDEVRSALSSGELASYEFELCYVPIVMGPEFVRDYPARSKVVRSEMRVYHSPKLEYEPFQLRREIDARNTILRGVIEAKTFFEDIEAEQLEEFSSKLSKLLK